MAELKAFYRTWRPAPGPADHFGQTPPYELWEVVQAPIAAGAQPDRDRLQGQIRMQSVASKVYEVAGRV